MGTSNNVGNQVQSAGRISIRVVEEMMGMTVVDNLCTRFGARRRRMDINEFAGSQYSKVELVEDLLKQLNFVARAVKSNDRVKINRAVKSRIELDDVVAMRCTNQRIETAVTVHPDIAAGGNDRVAAVEPKELATAES